MSANDSLQAPLAADPESFDDGTTPAVSEAAPSVTAEAEDQLCDRDELTRLREQVEVRIGEILDLPAPAFSISTITPESAAAFSDGTEGPAPCSILLIVDRVLTPTEAERLDLVSEGRAEAFYGEFQRD